MLALRSLPSAASRQTSDDSPRPVSADFLCASPVLGLALQEDAGGRLVRDFPAAGSVRRLHRHVRFDRVGLRIEPELEPRQNEIRAVLRHSPPRRLDGYRTNGTRACGVLSTQNGYYIKYLAREFGACYLFANAPPSQPIPHHLSAANPASTEGPTEVEAGPPFREP